MRRRATVRLTEEDLYYLLALKPGEHVVGVWAEPHTDSIIIGVEGDETTDLPEVAPGLVAPRIDRPYAVARLREQLRNIVVAHYRQEGKLSDECRRAIGEQVEREVFPDLHVTPVPGPTVP